MGFFETFWGWLQAQLTDYIGVNAARVAATLEPAAVSLAIVYVMIWGYLQLTGRIEEPFVAGLRRILMLAVVLGGALDLWLYDDLLVDTFYRAPTALAAAILGAGDPIGTVDVIWSRGGAVADQLWHSGAGSIGGFGFCVAAAVVWALIGTLCVYTMFLFALSNIATAVLLALGPLFIVMLLFDGSRRFFEAWIAQLTNYALIIVLTALVGALLLRVVQSYAEQTAALGSALQTVDALDLLLVSVLSFLLLRQIMPIAAGLAGGIALSTYGTASGFVRWGFGSRRFLKQGAVRAIGMLRAGRERDAAAKEIPVASEGDVNAAPSLPSWRDY